MGFIIELSVNMLKETNFSEIENTIRNSAYYHNCHNIYVSSEEDGTTKIPRYHCIFTIQFSHDNFDSCLNFIRYIKNYKPTYIECIYSDDMYKLLYASSHYLKSIEKQISNNYVKFIKDKKFTLNESKLLQEFNV